MTSKVDLIQALHDSGAPMSLIAKVTRVVDDAEVGYRAAVAEATCALVLAGAALAVVVIS